ncbi:hypothetical protein ACHAWF_002441 [Thalassiosira exigua]
MGKQPHELSRTHSNTSAFARPKDNSTLQPIEQQPSELRSEIAQVSYLIKQTSSQQIETQNLTRHAKARAYITKNKLSDIQNHVAKIPTQETLALKLCQ